MNILGEWQDPQVMQLLFAWMSIFILIDSYKKLWCTSRLFSQQLLSNNKSKETLLKYQKYEEIILLSDIHQSRNWTGSLRKSTFVFKSQTKSGQALSSFLYRIPCTSLTFMKKKETMCILPTDNGYNNLVVNGSKHERIFRRVHCLGKSFPQISCFSIKTSNSFNFFDFHFPMI